MIPGILNAGNLEEFADTPILVARKAQRLMESQLGSCTTGRQLIQIARQNMRAEKLSAQLLQYEAALAHGIVAIGVVEGALTGNGGVIRVDTCCPLFQELQQLLGQIKVGDSLGEGKGKIAFNP